MKPGPGEESLVAVDVAVDTTALAAVIFSRFLQRRCDAVVVVVVVGFAAVVVAAPSLTPSN